MDDTPAPIRDADFLSAGELRAEQERRWQRQAAYLAACSDFHRRLWAGRTPPMRLDALVELPMSDKEMLRADQRAHPPFGTYLAADPATIARIHRTSGTTGQAMNLALSAADIRTTAAVGGRGFRASGLGPGYLVVHTLNYQLWMGGLSDHLNLEATGAAVVPFGVGNSERLVETIREMGIDAISCTPSYPAVLERTLAEHFPGTRPRDLGLKLGLFGGEAGLDDPAFRGRLEDTWGFKVRNANYGVSDVLCLFGAQCEATNDIHLVGCDALWHEIVDSDTGAPKPWRAGETGELVLTHLAKDCQPLARFRSGDIVTLTALDRCACGRHAPRLRVVGRADDMVVVRGLNVFPTAVVAVAHLFKELSGEFRIVLPGPGPYDALPLEVELAEGRTASPALADAVAQAVKRHIGASARVRLLPWRALPRTEGKTRRVIRSSSN
ncbi:MAG: phenylacetate--CoA ligase [Alphaproteobacteria bacterium]|nr:phenylacetate--CoA ligase [Alphaproteobacteria bacterium]